MTKTLEEKLNKLDDIIHEIHALNDEAATIIQSNKKLLAHIEKETNGEFLSICCTCDEAQAAVDEFRDNVRSAAGVGGMNR